MTKLYLRKHINSLLPADQESEEYLKGIKSGDVVSCEIKKPRNYMNHRRYFSLLNIVLENQEMFKTVEQLKEAIKFELGYTELIRKMDGTFIEKPKSINFASMDESRFQIYFSRSIDVILEHVLPGTDREDLLAEVLAFG